MVEYFRGQIMNFAEITYIITELRHKPELKKGPFEELKRALTSKSVL